MKLSAIILLIFSLVSCRGNQTQQNISPPKKITDTNFACTKRNNSEDWQMLIHQAGGCFTGNQSLDATMKDSLQKKEFLWNKNYSREGFVFSDERWRCFLRSPDEEFVRFLVDKFASKKSTNLHVCPFRNAAEGELAVYCLQYSLGVNWYELDKQFEKFADTEDNRQDVLRKQLQSLKTRTTLAELFIKYLNDHPSAT